MKRSPPSESAIRDLAETIKRVIGYTGQLAWDPTKPDGQPHRRLDTTRAEQQFGFRASTSFEDGLRETVATFS